MMRFTRSGAGGARETPAPSTRLSDAVHLRVDLNGTQPAVWRRFRVPASITLRQLHSVLQDVMGWKDCHAHQFRVGRELYGIVSEDADGLKDSRWLTLNDILGQGVREFVYEYDLGGGWTHALTVEEIEGARSDNQRAVCLSGELACPPEDCGGPAGYRGVLDALRAKEPDPAQRELLRAAGARWDPRHFSAALVNARLNTRR